MDAMRSLWTRVEAALNRVAPRAVVALQEGALERTVDSLADTLGGALPPDLKNSLLVHDGQRPPYMSAVLFDNEYLLPCEQIAATWAMRNEVAADLRRDEAAPGMTSRWWDAIYIPVTESDGNGFCVHQDTGAVYYHTHDGEMEGPFFASWTGLLATLASKIEQGQFEVKHGAAWVALSAAQPGVAAEGAAPLR
jgi:cell wall assembly regulator SMI1